jgi:Spy/CpxP family protein refolding chaperone
MRKLSISSLIIVVAAIISIISIAAEDTLAQSRVNPKRQPGRFNDTSDPQLGRRKDRFPEGPQVGARPGQAQNRKRELQKRVMQAIGLTPDQHMRMQGIRRSHEDEAIAAGRRLRQARASLDRAIMSEPYNEAFVNRAIEEFAAAQADKTRLEARVRAELRSILTPEQVMRYHELERQFRQQRKQQIQQQQQQNEFDREMGTHLPNMLGPLPDDAEEFDLFALLFSID